MIDSVVAAESAQRDVALERALAEVDSLQTRLAEAEKHTEQFRLLGVNTEGMLKELRERSAANRAAQEEEIARYITRLIFTLSNYFRRDCVYHSIASQVLDHYNTHLRKCIEMFFRVISF